MDSAAPNQKVRQTGIVSTLLWVTEETPADISGEAERAAAKADNAAILREMGVAAGSAPVRHAHMHRTKSIDYAIVLSGEIDMLLDDSEVRLKAGDILVQQGTNHAWVNRSDEVCRIA